MKPRDWLILALALVVGWVVLRETQGLPLIPGGGAAKTTASGGSSGDVGGQMGSGGDSTSDIINAVGKQLPGVVDSIGGWFS